METGNKTSVFVEFGTEKGVLPVFPEKYSFDDRLIGPAAQAVLARLDFTAIASGQNPWMVFPANRRNEQVLSVPQGNPEERFSNLARAVEQKFGPGSTIVVY